MEFIQSRLSTSPTKIFKSLTSKSLMEEFLKDSLENQLSQVFLTLLELFHGAGNNMSLELLSLRSIIDSIHLLLRINKTENGLLWLKVTISRELSLNYNKENKLQLLSVELGSIILMVEEEPLSRSLNDDLWKEKHSKFVK
jgi:hypothetical protein